MRCAICGMSEEEAELYSGIYEDHVVKMCELCARRENIPVIKKPTKEQLISAEKNYTVRQRMERMTGRSPTNPSDLSRDHLSAQRNLDKLRSIPEKQVSDKLHENYHWKLTIARRRKKLTPRQLSEMSGVPEGIINGIERGILPANFEEPMMKLETTLNIDLLKDHEAAIRFIRKADIEKEILKNVGMRIGVKSSSKKSSFEDEFEEEIDLTEPQIEAKSKRLNQLSEGNLDLSKRSDLKDISLNDLVELKRKKDKRAQEQRLKEQKEAMFGGDVEIDFSEED